MRTIRLKIKKALGVFDIYERIHVINLVEICLDKDIYSKGNMYANEVSVEFHATDTENPEISGLSQKITKLGYTMSIQEI